MNRFLRTGCAALVACFPFARAAAQPPASGEWPCLFGPGHDSACTETAVNLDWRSGPPPILWKRDTGETYSAPAVSRGRLILFHRVKNDEVVECLDAAGGRSIWSHRYPTNYIDRYGYNGGPRCTPIIDDEHVYTYGAEGVLCCLTFDEGQKVWSRPLNAEYQVEQGFFGVGATPLLEGDRLVINLGAKTKGAGIVAVDKRSGKTLWEATDHGASYATPFPADVHGKRHVFVFSEAGVVSIEPREGVARWSIPFRSRLYESVNATSPIVSGDVLFVSASYRTGSLCLRIKEDGSQEELWRNLSSMDSHFSNLLVHEGHVFGFAGRHQQGAELRCVELSTGKVKWRVESLLGRGSMLRIGERLLLWGEEGHLASASLSTARFEFASFSKERLLTGPCWTPPVVAGGRLYLRNETRLLCLDVSPSKADDASLDFKRR